MESSSRAVNSGAPLDSAANLRTYANAAVDSEVGLDLAALHCPSARRQSG